MIAESSIERLPPHSIEAEQALLGSILLDARVALTQTVATVGTDREIFYDLRHQSIFDALLELWLENVPINIVSAVEKLRALNQLEAVGGITYVSVLPDASPSAAAVDYFLQIVEEKATLRRMIYACTRAVQSIYENEGTPEEMISAAERDVLAVRRQKQSKTAEVRELVSEANSDIDHLYNAKGAITGISTGLEDLDRKTNGLHGSEMIIIAAFPGGGKTALAMNIAERAAVDSALPVAVFSLEMSAKRLVMRMLGSRAQVNMRHIREGDTGAGDWESLKMASVQISNAPLHFCDQSDLTISQLRAKARQMVQQYGVKLIVVDYLQLIAGESKRREQSREQEVSAISRGLKQMAIEFKVPVLALSQLNDDGKLRESRAIGQDADSIWLLKKKDEKDTNPVARMSLIVTKQRDGEAPVTVDLDFYKAYTRFETVRKIEDKDAEFPLPYAE
jgi:replicative DNA helicase